jgi:hypothetical protein
VLAVLPQREGGAVAAGDRVNDSDHHYIAQAVRQEREPVSLGGRLGGGAEVELVDELHRPPPQVTAAQVVVPPQEQAVEASDGPGLARQCVHERGSQAGVEVEV